jgi:hypothetical protein
VDLGNLIEPQLAPILFTDAGALVPKVDFTSKTVHDKRFEFLDRHMASGALRASRHFLCHETSLRTLKLSELRGCWELWDGFKQFECRNKKPRSGWYAADWGMDSSEELG